MRHALLILLMAIQMPLLAESKEIKEASNRPHPDNQYRHRHPGDRHPGPGYGDGHRNPVPGYGDDNYGRPSFQPLVSRYRGQRFSSHYDNRLYLKKDLKRQYGRDLNLRNFPLQRVEVYARPIYGDATVSLQINGYTVGTRTKSSYYGHRGPLVFYVNPWQAHGPWQLVVNRGEIQVKKIVFIPENRHPRRPPRRPRY